MQCLPTDRAHVEIVVTSPPRQAVNEFYHLFGRTMDHRQFRLRTPVTDAPTSQQADDITTALNDTDPRLDAEICGGYTHTKLS